MIAAGFEPATVGLEKQEYEDFEAKTVTVNDGDNVFNEILNKEGTLYNSTIYMVLFYAPQLTFNC